MRREAPLLLLLVYGGAFSYAAFGRGVPAFDDELVSAVGVGAEGIRDLEHQPPVGPVAPSFERGDDVQEPDPQSVVQREPQASRLAEELKQRRSVLRIRLCMES